MLYIYSGERFESRNLCTELINICKEKRPLAEYIHLSKDSAISPKDLLEYTGLFEKRFIVLCDEIASSAQCIFSDPAPYVSSPHIFIVFEPGLKPAAEKKIVSCGAVSKRSSKIIESKNNSLFKLADVFLNNDVEKSFVYFHTVLYNGESPFSVFNIILWQIKVLAIVSSTDVKSSGLNPYVYNKAKSRVSNFDNPPLLYVRSEECYRKCMTSGLSDMDAVERILILSVKVSCPPTRI